MGGMNKIGPPVNLPNVLMNTKARYVQEALRSRGFRSLRYGTNTYILKSLPQNQYQGFLKLLDIVREHIQKNYSVSDLLPLTLPWARKLRIVDFEKLLSSEAALRKVFDYCVMQDKVGVDFNLLPQIYNAEVVKNK